MKIDKQNEHLPVTREILIGFGYTEVMGVLVSPETGDDSEPMLAFYQPFDGRVRVFPCRNFSCRREKHLLSTLGQLRDAHERILQPLND